MTNISLRAPAQTSTFTETVTTILAAAMVVVAGVLTFAVPYLA